LIADELTQIPPAVLELVLHKGAGYATAASNP
jgi:hypothetical protein